MEYVVRGRVQGVGFRYFVLSLAHEHGLDGEVWNARDGSVQIVASHPDSDVLASFEEALHSGPGRVSSVTSSPYDYPVTTGFRVTDTR